MPFRPTTPALPALALALLLVATLATLAAAQWSSDPAANTPVCTAPGAQWRPATVPDGDGGMLVVWSDGRPDSGGLYAQHFDRYGLGQWGANGMRVGRSVFAWQGEVASDGGGGIVFAWSDAAVGPAPVIRAQRLTRDGVRLWGPDGVTVSSVPAASVIYYDARIALAGDGAGGAAIAWPDSGQRLVVQVVDASGQRAWPQEVRVDDGPCHQVPRVASDGRGGAIACWKAFAVGVAGQRVDAAGTLRWGATPRLLPNDPANSDRPNLVPDGAGGAFASWLQYASQPPYRRMFAQRFDSLGAAQWGPQDLDVSPDAYVESDTLLSDGQGGFFAAWLNDGLGLAQHFDASGTPLWPAPGVPFDTHYVYRATTVLSAAPDGGVHLCWYAYGANPAYRVQRLSAAGEREWGPAGLPLTTNSSFFGGWGRALAPDGAGGLMAVWEDARNNAATSTDLYAQRWNASGTLAVPPAAGAPALALAAAPVPMARGAGTTLRFALPEAGAVRLAIHDVTGRLVRVVQTGPLEPGAHVSRWDGRDAAGNAAAPGLYFARLVARGRTARAKLVVTN